jgi:hypothetical protein
MSSRVKRVLTSTLLGVLAIAVAAYVAIAWKTRDARADNGNPPNLTHGSEPAFAAEVDPLSGGGYWDGESIQAAYFFATDDQTAPADVSMSAAALNMTNIAGSSPTVSTSTSVSGGMLVLQVSVTWAPGQLQYTSSYQIQATATDAGGNSTQLTMTVDRL